ncbi:MAG: restriction endonuclease subunit S [Bacteroidales bacterium]|nr:restriction endonuclease subunit S [Bacteroidales bacterium]
MKKIDITSWQAFRIDSLFKVVKGTRLTKANMKEGNINFIGASAMNNGITATIGNTEKLHPSNTITVSYNGSVGESFYQMEQFWASDDVNVLYPKFELNENIALFIIPIIKRIGKQYAFVNKWKKEDMEKDFILLPSINGIPDFAYMENYMKRIMTRQQENFEALQKFLSTNK